MHISINATGSTYSIFSESSVLMDPCAPRKMQLVKIVIIMMMSNIWCVLQCTAILLVGFQGRNKCREGVAEKRKIVMDLNQSLSVTKVFKKRKEFSIRHTVLLIDRTLL
jgi:hypothetical protein